LANQRALGVAPVAGPQSAFRVLTARRLPRPPWPAWAGRRPLIS